MKGNKVARSRASRAADILAKHGLIISEMLTGKYDDLTDSATQA
jgi:hypothetical protein